MKPTLARIHIVLAWILFLGSITQFFLIALSVFGAAESEVHGIFGFLLALVALIMVILSLIIRVNKWNVILSIVAFLLLFPIQGILVHLEGIPGAVRSIHALTGLVILASGYVMANGFAKAVVPAEKKSDETQTATDSD